MIARRGHPIAGEPWLDTVMSMPRSKWMQAVRPALDPILEANPEIRPTDGNKALLMDAWNALVREDVRRYRQDVEAPHNDATRSRERLDLRLRQLLALWQDDRQPSAQYVKEATTAVDDLISYAGDLPAAAITSTVIMNYRDAAKRLPAAMPRADRQLPFMARVEKHADTAAPRVTATTLKKRIGAIQALLGYAFNEKMLAANAGLGVRISGYTRKGRRRRSFMDDELKALFESPLFLRPDQILKRRNAVGDPTLYWLFVLGCTSGARLEEVGQVRVADVRTDGGHLYLDITDVEAVELDEDDRAANLVEKKLKTEESDRYVPIHPIALRLGFGRYLDALRRHGSLLLFPDLGKANELGKVTQEASRLLNRYVDRHAAKDRRLVFYSLRHKFKDEGRDADVQKYILDQICGHAPVSVGDGYGSGAKIATLMRHLAKLRFEMVDWAALERAAAAIDWDKVVAEVMLDIMSTLALRHIAHMHRELFGGSEGFHRHYLLWLHSIQLISSPDVRVPAGLKLDHLKEGRLTEEGRAVLLMLRATAPEPLSMIPDMTVSRPIDDLEAFEARLGELRHAFVRDRIGDRPMILLHSRAHGPVIPFTVTSWSQAFDDDETRDAFYRFLVQHVDRWHEWGELALQARSDGLSAQMLRLFASVLATDEQRATSEA